MRGLSNHLAALEKTIALMRDEIAAERRRSEPRRYTKAEWASVILANLTDDDFERFHSAHIKYSGSTGKGSVKGYEPDGPYIATFMFELPAALIALDWTRVHLEHRGGQWIVRRERRCQR
jgi:hypothetical protein